MWQQLGWVVVVLLTLVAIVLVLTAKPGALFDELTSQGEERKESEEEENVVEGSLEHPDE